MYMYPLLRHDTYTFMSRFNFFLRSHFRIFSFFISFLLAPLYTTCLMSLTGSTLLKLLVLWVGILGASNQLAMSVVWGEEVWSTLNDLTPVQEEEQIAKGRRRPYEAIPPQR